MTITHSISINVPRTVVFSVYSKVASWPSWDSEITKVQLPELRQGATGWLKPRHGPKARITVIETIQDRSFTIESRLPFCRVQFEHALTEENGTTTATHRVHFIGPLSAIFRRMIGKGIDQTLPQTLAGLKKAAERSEACL